LAFGMSTSRGPRLALSLLAILLIASPARAQGPGEPSAVIRLVAQTAWTIPEKPLLRITLRISNDGEATIVDPDIVWTLGPKVTSRIQYETALEEGPELTASAETIQLPGDLAPGSSTEVAVRIDSSETGGIVQDDSGVYPLKLELRSEDQPIAAVTTAAIHIFQPPQKRVLFSWWTEVATPIAFGPDGTLVDPGFEAALGSHEGVAAQVQALADVLRVSPSGAPIDVIVSPAALDQLRQAEDGYAQSDGTSVPADAPPPEAAAQTLDRLREIAGDPGARLHAMPFAAPRLTALQSSPLRAHLEEQWRLGDETFEQILDEQPDPTVARPPGLAFDQTSVDLLDARGVTTILGAADSVDRPRQPNDFAPPPAATLSTTSGNRIELLLPDPGAQALVSDAELLEDPVRAAQVVLGELATIWKEEPVPPRDETNGLALELPPDLPAAIWGPMVLRLSRAPFLEQVHAGTLPHRVQPPPPLLEGVSNPAPAGFSTAYAEDLATTDRRVAAFGSILEEPAGEVDLLRRAMLYAEASQYIGNEGSGHVWIDSVNGLIDRTFSRLKPDTSRVLTFTSRAGTIPLRMGDPGDRVLNVTVRLESGRVDFLDGEERTVRLDQANQVITFPVEVKAAGPSDIEVSVISPNGAVLSRSVLVVRSTAVNPIALIITTGAGLVLLGLWSRRLFRRRHP
jgi:hypothetical protein